MYPDMNAYEEAPRLRSISSADLTDKRFDKIEWIVEGLLKPGLTVLAGAPKIGKSWLVLNLCLSVSNGCAFLGRETCRSAVLYITLEDSEFRVQERLIRIAEETSDDLQIALSCPALGSDLKEAIAVHCGNFPKTRLIVIDTFQKIREQAGQMTYAGDYADVSAIKEIADDLNISILLVHHTRKLGDSDYINEISGTNGIAGSADTLLLLKKEKRTDSKAILSCTGRDIEDREISLAFGRDTCIWQVIDDDYQPERKEIPELIMKLIVYVGKIGSYDGTAAEFCERFVQDSGEDILPNHLRRLMNRYRYELEDAGIYFISLRKNGIRRFAIYCKKRENALRLSREEAEQEQALWDQPYEAHTPPHEADTDLPPTPTDDDAPPIRRHEREESDYAYHPYR